MTRTRNLLFNAASSYAGMIVIIVASVATKILLARVLSPKSLGMFISGQTVFGMLVFVGSLGMNDAVARYAGMGSGAGYFGAARGIMARGLRVVLCSGTLLGFTSAIAIYVCHRTASFAHPALLLFSLALPLKNAADIVGAANQGTGRLYFKVLIVDLIPAIFFCAALLILLLSDSTSLTAVLAVYLAPMMVAVLLFPSRVGIWGITRGDPSPASLRELLRYSIPLLVSGVVAWPMTAVPVIIGGLLSAEAVSYYGLAISFGSFIYLGTSALEAAGISVWTSYLAAGETGKLGEDYRLSTRGAMLIGAPLFAVLLLLPREVVGIVVGQQYAPVATILPAVSCIFFANLMTGPTESLLKAHGETKFILWSRLAAGCVVLATLFPFVVLWGLNGAIGSYALSVATGGVLMYSARLYVRFKLHPFDRHWCWTVTAIACALSITAWVIGMFLENNPPLLRVVIAAITFTASLAILIYLLPSLGVRERSAVASVVGRLLAFQTQGRP